MRFFYKIRSEQAQAGDASAVEGSSGAKQGGSLVLGCGAMMYILDDTLDLSRKPPSLSFTCIFQMVVASGKTAWAPAPPVFLAPPPPKIIGSVHGH